MNKIWKHPTNGQIVISINRPPNDTDNPNDEYTDETNIANWIGMMRKKNITLENIQQYVYSYISEKNLLTEYDEKWYKIYTNRYKNPHLEPL